MAVNKRCAASGRALQAESAASEIQHVKIHLRQNRSIYMHERRFAVMSSKQPKNQKVCSAFCVEDVVNDMLCRAMMSICGRNCCIA